MLNVLNKLNKPTIACVQGAAYGSAIGLLACCHIAIAARDATFCFPEVRLGLVPSVIGTYVVAAIGERYARRYHLTAESLDASEAYRIGTGMRSVRTGYTGRDDKLALRAVAARRTVRAGGYRKFITVAARREQDVAPRDKSVLQIATAEAREGVAAHLRERPRLG